MRGINMSNSELWKKFLDNMKEVISSTSFDIWFNEDDTKLYSFKNDIATITVTQELYKKHLEEHYIDDMKDAMRKATNNDVTFDIYCCVNYSCGRRCSLVKCCLLHL